MYIRVFLIVTIFILTIVNYFYNAYNYWTKKGVPSISVKFPLGNANTFIPRAFSVGTLSKKFYDELKRKGHKFGGIYLVTEPNLIVVDPKYIKDILCKDFQHFVDRGFYYNKKDDPMSAHLFAIDGVDWKNLRTKLTPTFTSGKRKMMFHSVIECCDYMKEAIEGSLSEDVDVKEMLGRYATDVIGSCAFGIKCNSFKYPDAEFRTMGRKIFTYSVWRKLRGFCLMTMPKLSVRLGFKATNREVRDFFRKTVADTVRLRQDKNIRRNDFLQILIDMQNTSNVTLDEITAQVYLFFIAGFETTSTAMTFALYELARHPEIQTKLRQEVEQILAKHDGELTYDSLKEMKYLEQIIDETLRIYPPFPSINRRCTKNYTLRDTNIVIEEGTPVLISALGLHMDPEFYPEPENFDPDRFSEENKKSRHPFVHLPFGEGPRNCIGLRFGLMQSKIGLVTVIKNFRWSVSPLTQPVKFDPYAFLLDSVNKVYLRAEKV
ncbi:cytochrome P450 6a2-like [Zophobas morio]|uniref:cytochrome P450 6a2-like n=1 Tax=Zophobas morio TaxID=2755281 RepID=UPI003082B4A7